MFCIESYKFLEASECHFSDRSKKSKKIFYDI